MVRAVPAGDVPRAKQIAAHPAEVLSTLHHHHTGEDELLWPKLLQRAEMERPLIERMESQHGQVAELSDEARQLLPG